MSFSLLRLRAAQEPISKIVIQNVEVATAGQVIQKDPEGKPVTVTVVTLFVTPEDAEKITNASTQGTVPISFEAPAGSGRSQDSRNTDESVNEGWCAAACAALRFEGRPEIPQVHSRTPTPSVSSNKY